MYEELNPGNLINRINESFGEFSDVRIPCQFVVFTFSRKQSSLWLLSSAQPHTSTRLFHVLFILRIAANSQGVLRNGAKGTKT
jgi:hypothetical protein